MTTTVASLNTNKNKKKLCVLLDTGSHSSFLRDNYFKHCSSVKKHKTTYNSAGGTFNSSKKGTLEFRLPEFSTSKKIPWNFVSDAGRLDSLGYDMIIGRDLMTSLKMIIDFEYQVLRWENIGIPMNRNKQSKQDLHSIFESSMESKPVQEATGRATKILDASYTKADLINVVAKNCKHLSERERAKMLALLRDFEPLFDGTLGELHTDPIDLGLKPGSKPKHHKAFLVPRIHEKH